MKTIFTSSPIVLHSGAKAFTAMDLLLKNKYVAGANDCHLFHLEFSKKNISFSPHWKCGFLLLFLRECHAEVVKVCLGVN